MQRHTHIHTYLYSAAVFRRNIVPVLYSMLYVVRLARLVVAAQSRSHRALSPMLYCGLARRGRRPKHTHTHNAQPYSSSIENKTVGFAISAARVATRVERRLSSILYATSTPRRVLVVGSFFQHMRRRMFTFTSTCAECADQLHHTHTNTLAAPAGTLAETARAVHACIFCSALFAVQARKE